jgi:hypothetical protein
MECKKENKINLETKTKTLCFNNYNSYLLCKGLANDLYLDQSKCEEIKKNLLDNCVNSHFINKSILNKNYEF